MTGPYLEGQGGTVWSSGPLSIVLSSKCNQKLFWTWSLIISQGMIYATEIVEQLRSTLVIIIYSDMNYSSGYVKIESQKLM